MAQDFKAAFYPGRDHKSISTLEFDGVELAAIQAFQSSTVRCSTVQGSMFSPSPWTLDFRP